MTAVDPKRTLLTPGELGLLRTMGHQPPLAILIRIPAVAMSQAELNASLKLEVDRYEAPQNRTDGYAQLNIADSGDQWRGTLNCIQSIAGPIRELVSAGSIGPPILDMALHFPDTSLTKSWRIPADVAAAAGVAGIDIMLSVYLTDEAGS